MVSNRHLLPAYPSSLSPTAASHPTQQKKLHPSIVQIRYGVDLGVEFPPFCRIDFCIFRPAHYRGPIPFRIWEMLILYNKELAAICVLVSICHQERAPQFFWKFVFEALPIDGFTTHTCACWIFCWIIKSLIIRWKMTHHNNGQT